MTETAEFERDVERLVRFVTRQRATANEIKSASNLDNATTTTLLEDVTEMLSHKIDDERLWDLADLRPVSEQVRVADASMSIVEAPVPLKARDVLVDDATWRRLETALGPLADFDFVACGLVPAGGMPAGVVADTASSDIDLFLVGHARWDECERAVDAVARHLRAELVRRYRARAASECATRRDRRAQTAQTGTNDGASKEKRQVAATPNPDVITTDPLPAASPELSGDSVRKAKCDDFARSESTRAAAAAAVVVASAEAKEPASTVDPLQKNKNGAVEEGKEEERDDEKCHDLDVRRTIGCCTFSSVREKFVVQIVLKRYASTQDVLGGFDNGSCSVALLERTGSAECCGVEHGVANGDGGDGEEKLETVVASPPTKNRGRLVTSRRGRVSYKWRTNYVDLRCRRVTFETRYLKYQARGWHMALPESCAARIQPGMRYLDMQYMTLCVDYMRDNCVRTRVVCYRQPDGGRRGTFEVYCADPERCAHAAHHILSVTYRDAGVQRRHALRRDGAWRSAQRWRESQRRETKRRSDDGARTESTPQRAVMPPPPVPPTVTMVCVEAPTRDRVKPRNWFLECRDSDDGESSESDQSSESEDGDGDDDDDEDGDGADGKTVDAENREGAIDTDGSGGGDGRPPLSVDTRGVATAEKNESPERGACGTEKPNATSSPTSAEDEDERTDVADPEAKVDGKPRDAEEGGAEQKGENKSDDDDDDDEVAAIGGPGTGAIDADTSGCMNDSRESCVAAAAAAGDSDDALTRPVYDLHGYNYLAATQYQSASNYAAVRLRGPQSVYSVVACARYVLGMRCTAVQSLFTDLHLVVAKYLACNEDEDAAVVPVVAASAIADARERQRRRLIEVGCDEWRQENMAHLERILGRDETAALVELLARHPTKLEAAVGRLAQAAAAVVQIPPAADRVHDAHLEALFGDLTARLFSRWCHAPANPSGSEPPLCADQDP